MKHSSTKPRTGYATRGGGNTTGDPALTSASSFGNAGAGLTGDPIADFVNGGISTAQSEALGSDEGANAFQQMAFSIERTAVQAKTRALKAEYSTELAQDLRAVHGLDAETELANILSTEILSEINREVVRTILKVAKLGCQQTDLKGKGTTPRSIWNRRRRRWYLRYPQRFRRSMVSRTLPWSALPNRT